MKWLFAVAAVFGSACAGEIAPGDLVLRIDARDEELLEAARQAAAEWARCGGDRRVLVSTVDGVPLRRVDPRDPILHRNNARVHFLDARDLARPAWIVVRGDRPELLRPLVAHEVGHVLLRTLEHSGEGSIMAGRPARPSDTVTELDCAMLRRR